MRWFESVSDSQRRAVIHFDRDLWIQEAQDDQSQVMNVAYAIATDAIMNVAQQ